MTGTFASRAFFTSAAIFGTEATHVGRGGQMTEVMSSTSRAAPLTGTSTATGSAIFGIGEVGVGAAVGAGRAGVVARPPGGAGGEAALLAPTTTGVAAGPVAGVVVHEASRAALTMSGG